MKGESDIMNRVGYRVLSPGFISLSPLLIYLTNDLGKYNASLFGYLYGFAYYEHGKNILIIYGAYLLFLFLVAPFIDRALKFPIQKLSLIYAAFLTVIVLGQSYENGSFSDSFLKIPIIWAIGLFLAYSHRTINSVKGA